MSSLQAWSLDGFRPEDASARLDFDASGARWLFANVERLSRLLGVRIEGIERLPEGRALLVANHAFGWDVLFVMARIWREKRRPVWVLGEHVFWKFPFLRRLARAAGTVDGTRANLDDLLSRDQLVLVLPGGLREAVKPRELRYRLLWGHRYGFVRAAIRHAAPLVPLASVGTDDLFDFVGNAYARGRRWLGRADIPLPIPSRLLPIPHFVPLRFIIGQPISPPVTSDRENDGAAVQRFRWEVAGALHELIDIELARRSGIDLG
jgi:1-acyl-sn-glycerol-3-phosphate acyltransferase